MTKQTRRAPRSRKRVSRVSRKRRVTKRRSRRTREGSKRRRRTGKRQRGGMLGALATVGRDALATVGRDASERDGQTPPPQADLEGLQIIDPSKKTDSTDTDTDVIVINEYVSITLKIDADRKNAKLQGFLNVEEHKVLSKGLAGPTMLLLLQRLLDDELIQGTTNIIVTGSLAEGDEVFYKAMGFNRDTRHNINSELGRYKCQVSTFLSKLEETFT